ncbi:DUF1553 domain-containing protein [Planctomycetota bacterium]
MNRRVRILLVSIAAIGVFAGPAIASNESISEQHRDFFESKIRPVLVEHCYECHSQDSKTLQGGLLLDSREGILAGGDSGEAVVVGDSVESMLIQSIEYGDDSYQMPPKGRLSDETVADFRKWIDIGLPDPRIGTARRSVEPADVDAGRNYWSFQPVARPEPPAPQSSWPRTSIDRFIERKISAAKLTPAADADPRTLVRRIYIDLIGLPPSVEQVDAFLGAVAKSDVDEAVRGLVDELLESDRFGERWARHWLDVVRYAESSGGGRTLIFPNAWRYRDYVIESFNADKPYDEFIREQIAGDLLDADSERKRSQQLIATSFLALGPTNYELQDKELLRMEVVDEQLDTIGRSMLGLTVGCARCHDHKFDPISMNDYYAMAGIFRSTKTFTLGNVANFIERPLPSREFEKRKTDFDEKLKAMSSELDTAKTEFDQIKKRIVEIIGEVDFFTWISETVDTDSAELIGEWTESTSMKGFVGKNYLHDGNRGKGKKRIVYSLDLPPQRFELQASYTPGTNRTTNATFRVHHAGGTTDVAVNQKRDPAIEGQFTSLGSYEFSAEQKGKIELVTTGTNGYVIADAIRWIPLSSDNVDSADNEPDLKNQFAKAKSRVSRLKHEVEELKKQRPANSSKAMSVLEEEKPSDWHVHIRGQVRNLGPVVPRGFVSVISSNSTLIAEGQSGRAELANWIASDENPLTARVMVNRMWHHLIGEGIVRSPDNFGAMGRGPTHPELLDHLAAEFVENGWSMKQIIRQIMNSRVYQLGENADPNAIRLDPNNEMLAYRNPRRMDAESLRDAILAVSGQLDLTMFGDTQEKGTKSEVDYKFASNRRSIYVPWFRNTQLDALQIFDAANPNVVTGRRTVTSIPTQALFLMNSEFVQVAARNFAERILADKQSDNARINKAYLIAVGRSARDSEREVLLVFIAMKRSKGISESESWTQVCHLILASVDFRTI